MEERISVQTVDLQVYLTVTLKTFVQLLLGSFVKLPATFILSQIRPIALNF